MNPFATGTSADHEPTLALRSEKKEGRLEEKGETSSRARVELSFSFFLSRPDDLYGIISPSECLHF